MIHPGSQARKELRVVYAFLINTDIRVDVLIHMSAVYILEHFPYEPMKKNCYLLSSILFLR